MSTTSIKNSVKRKAASVKNKAVSGQRLADGGKSQTRSASGITWGPAAAIIIVIVLYILTQLIAGLIISLYPLLKHWNSTTATNWVSNSLYGQFFYVLLAEGLTVLGLWWFIRRRKGRLAAIGLSKATSKDPLYSLLGFAIYFPVYIVIVSILSNLIHSFNVNQSQALGFSQSTTGWPLVLVFLSLVLLPAIVEEILFRGFLFSGLKKALPIVWAAVLTSVIFASPHLLEANSGGALWIAGVDTFVLSLVLCWLREKTGRLYAGMGLHALKNFIAFASLFLLHVH